MSKRYAIESFLGYKEIILFTAVVCIMLVLLFPKKEIITMILSDPGYVPPEFIKAVIKVDPAEKLKIALIRNYIKAGEYGKAEGDLKKIDFALNSMNIFDYTGLKFRLLEADYYLTNNAKKKRYIGNSIESLLSMLAIVKTNTFKKYIADNGRQRVKWLFDSYKFESELGDNRLALDMMHKYLIAYPEYKSKYLPEITVLYVDSGKWMKSYEILVEYVKTHKNYNKKVKLFESVIEKSILKKNHKLTLLLLRFYKENFSKSLKVEKFILTYALQSDDPYFARIIAIKLSNRDL